jgi:hypothetical protein
LVLGSLAEAITIETDNVATRGKPVNFMVFDCSKAGQVITVISSNDRRNKMSVIKVFVVTVC